MCNCKFKIDDKVRWNGKSLFAHDSWDTYYPTTAIYTIKRIEPSEMKMNKECHFLYFKEYALQGWGCCDLELVRKSKLKLPSWW